MASSPPARPPPAADWERWNTHFEKTVSVDLLDTTFRLAQDPASGHLGSTVWDASIVLAGWLEKNARKGELSRGRLAGKKAVELGAGMGLGGLALAALGADVLLTDVDSVLPLLAHNAGVNLGPAARREAPWGPDAGEVSVGGLDWCDDATWAHALGGAPYDVLLAADCVYKEALVGPLCRAVLALTSRRSTVVVANELRSTSVQAAFDAEFGRHFTWRAVPAARLHPTYRHPAIRVLLLKRRSAGAEAAAGGGEEGGAVGAAARPEGGAPGPGGTPAKAAGALAPPCDLAPPEP